MGKLTDPRLRTLLAWQAAEAVAAIKDAPSVERDPPIAPDADNDTAPAGRAALEATDE